MPRKLLIAGGNSGIGLATVTRLSQTDDVTCLVRNADALGELPVTTHPYSATEADAELPIPDALDGLVYFPGSINLKPFARLSDADFMKDLEINLMGAVRLIRAAVPALKKTEQSTASIVLFSTVAVGTGMSFHASVAAAKGALEGLGRSLAAELAPKIRVNLIAPSLTDTPMAAHLLGSDDKVEASKARHPLKQIGEPSEFAAAVDFLLSEDAGFMTGQVLRLDGGLSTLKML